jgi:hypothetical protein
MMNDEQREQSETNPMEKMMAETMQPVVDRAIEGVFKEGKVDFNNEWMQKMVRKMLAQNLDELPEEAKAALGKTQVDIVRRSDRVEIIIDSGGDADVEKVKDVMLDSLLAPISQIVTLFGCQANVEQSSKAATD